MSIVINLSADLQSKLADEASRHSLSLSEYVLKVISNGGEPRSSVQTGAELVAYWQQAGLVGTRPQITDSQQHARQLRDSIMRGSPDPAR